MKNFLYFLFLTITSNTLNAQQFAVIKGTIISDNPINISVYKPINGFFNSSFYMQEGSPEIYKTENHITAFQDSVSVNNACFVRIYFASSDGDFLDLCNLLVFPNDTVELHYSTKDSTFKFTGNNAKGHELFYPITKEPALVSRPADDIINLFPDNRTTFVKELIEYGDKLSYPFEQLFNQGLISQQYFQTINDNLHLWPLNMAATKLLFSTKRGTIIPKQIIDSTIEEIYKVYPPTNNSHSLLNTDSYYLDYQAFQAYNKHHLISPKVFYSSDSIIHQNGRKIELNREFVRFLYIDDPVIRQNEWGFFLTKCLLAPEIFTISDIKKYEELNPVNNWSKILRRYVASLQPAKPISYKLTSPIVEIADSIKVNTFAELVKLLSQSDFYYVDVWSSWCGPCVKAFSANAFIDSVLQLNHITKVYVSIDNNKEAWVKAVDKYALGGYNIMANKSLMIDVMEMLGININSSFSIPRYLLINEKGEFVKELYSPLTREKLANQIKDLVEKNRN